MVSRGCEMHRQCVGRCTHGTKTTHFPSGVVVVGGYGCNGGVGSGGDDGDGSRRGFAVEPMGQMNHDGHAYVSSGASVNTTEAENDSTKCYRDFGGSNDKMTTALGCTCYVLNSGRSEGKFRQNYSIFVDGDSTCSGYNSGGSSRKDSMSNSKRFLKMMMMLLMVMTAWTVLCATTWIPQGSAAPVEGDKVATKYSLGDQSEDDIEAVKSTLLKLEQEMLHEENITVDNLEIEVPLFEGDILLTPAEAENILASSRNRKRRKISADLDKRWPLPIHYRFNDSPKYKLNATEKAAILSAMKELSDLTCITFKEFAPGDQARPVLDFRKDFGCWSYVGREKAFQFQEISTAAGCFQRGTLLHELGHAIGFWHEQSRPDRDNYVIYLEENVDVAERFNFKRESWGTIDNMGVPYDVGSIMHYGSKFFSKNKELTLETRDPLLQRNLGQRQAFSFFDVKLANMAYCKDACPTAKFSCLHDGYPDPKACDRCRCPDGLSGSMCQYAAQSKGTTCGGPTYVDHGARYTIKSPGYPWAYMGNVECNWLFQARPGMRLYLEVKQDNFMRHPDCSRSNTSVCSDYLEVKYNLSFGYTGARFCCGQAPPDVIVSNGNTMLVLFRTIKNGIGGFSADIYTEPCGGCHKTGQIQKACHTTETVPCSQEWYDMVYVACPLYYRPPTYVCNKYLPKKKSRTSSCQVEKQKCCDGHTLQKGFCIPVDHTDIDSTTISGNDVTTIKDTTRYIPGSNDVTYETPTGWTTWGSWSQCSATCGGCGRRSRVRTCADLVKCGGQRQDSETQVCNTQPCPSLQAYACHKTVTEEYNCGWINKCYRTRKELQQCVTRCCPHYETKNDICQQVSNRKRKKRR